MVRDLGVDEARQLDPFLRELRLQLVAVEDVRRERPFHVHHVELAFLKREKARLVLFDDADLDSSDLRHFLALHLGDQFEIGRVVRFEIPHEAAVVGVRFQHDLGASNPLLENVRPGADRIRHRAARLVGIRFDDFARDRRRRLMSEHVGQVVIGVVQPNAKRVAIRRFKTGDLRVVIEFAGLMIAAFRVRALKQKSLNFVRGVQRVALLFVQGVRVALHGFINSARHGAKGIAD